MRLRYGFLHAVEFEAKEAFGRFEGPLAYAEFFIQDWVRAVIFARWEDIVYPVKDPLCNMLHQLFCCQNDTGDEVVHINLN